MGSGHIFTAAKYGDGFWPWVEHYVGPGGPKLWVDITSASGGSKLAAVMWEGNIYTSSDEGKTWVEDTSVGAKKPWNAITSSSDFSKLAAVVYQGNIWYSHDGGSTWVEDTSIGAPKLWKDITSSSDGSKLAAVDYGGNIWTAVAASPTAASTAAVKGESFVNTWQAVVYP
jgi:photosystem II stability/assembly factor-like uncharacterized protein